MKWAKEEEKVKVVILTGRGKYYSSGQELGLPNFEDEGLFEEMERRRKTTA